MEHQILLDGITYHAYHTQPESSRGVVLLLHAIMANHHMYDSTVDALAQAGYETISFDHIGHGQTSSPETPTQALHLDDICQHANAIVKAIKGPEHTRLIAVVGCSVGGVIALRYAMVFPGTVDSIVSMCAPGMKSLEISKPLWTERILKFQRDVENGTDLLQRETLQRWIPGDTSNDQAIRDAVLPQLGTCTFQGYRILADAIRGYDYEDEMRTTKWPRALVICGSEDAAAPREVVEGIAKKVSGARFVELEGCGHLPPMHQREVFEKMLLEFLNE